jgi:bifunctional non-homologous end joining protein LigD
MNWDGYRLAFEPQRVRLITRGGYDWTDRFPSIADDARRLSVETAILDGEAVVLDDRGRADFSMLQRALGRLPTPYDAGAIVLCLRLALPRRMRAAPVASARSAAAARTDRRRSGKVLFDYRRKCRRTATSFSASPVSTASRHRRKAQGAAVSLWPSARLAEDQVRSQRQLCDRDLRAVDDAWRDWRLLLAARKGEGLVYVGGCGTGWT